MRSKGEHAVYLLLLWKWVLRSFTMLGFWSFSMVAILTGDKRAIRASVFELKAMSRIGMKSSYPCVVLM